MQTFFQVKKTKQLKYQKLNNCGEKMSNATRKFYDKQVN